jgi:hypothetical protein
MIDITEGKDEELAVEEPARRAYKRARKERSQNRKNRGKDEMMPLERRDSEKRIVAQHSSKSAEHYTPEDVIKSARWLMGDIDLDPASNCLANERIQAKKYFGYTENGVFCDGLIPSWHGKVWLNPPGGNTADIRPELSFISRSFPCVWWGKLISEYEIGNVEQAMFLVYQLNMLQAVQNVKGVFKTFFDFSMCFFKERLRFGYPEDTFQGLPIKGTRIINSQQPPGASAIVYLYPKLKGIDETFSWKQRFNQAFAYYGIVIL